MRIQRTIDVHVSAADAWALLADGFGDIGDWTTAVDASRLVGDHVAVGAERHCRISGPGSGDGLAVERVTDFDPAAMTYSYELVRGPRFIKTARNVISICPLASERCRIDADGDIKLVWWLAPLFPLVSLALRSAVDTFFRDVRHRLERGAPHPDVLAARH